MLPAPVFPAPPGRPGELAPVAALFIEEFELFIAAPATPALVPAFPFHWIVPLFVSVPLQKTLKPFVMMLMPVFIVLDASGIVSASVYADYHWSNSKNYSAAVKCN